MISEHSVAGAFRNICWGVRDSFVVLNTKTNILNGVFEYKVQNVYKLVRIAIQKGWHRALFPDATKGGRVCAAKFYPFEGENMHVALDCKGKAQIFGAKTVDQCRLMATMMKKTG